MGKEKYIPCGAGFIGMGGWVTFVCLVFFLNEISYRVLLDRLRIVPENPGFGLGS